MRNASGLRSSQVGEEANQKDYYDQATHYDTLWGKDNIHLGYYPHLSAHFPTTSDYAVMDMKQAAFVYNGHMINVGRITNKDTVIDLGCGKGHGPLQICKQTNAKVVGLDIGTANIARCNELADENPDCDLTFFEGTFTDIPAEIKKRKYSVVFAQLAINHNHAELRQVLEQVKEIMAPDGRFVISDYLGCDGEQSEETKEHVMKRLHFDMLYGHQGWRKACEEAGFFLQYYENLDDHMVQSYRDLALGAYEHGFISADGAKLGDNYTKTALACERGDIGMNLAVLTLTRRSKLN